MMLLFEESMLYALCRTRNEWYSCNHLSGSSLEMHFDFLTTRSGACQLRRQVTKKRKMKGQQVKASIPPQNVSPGMVSMDSGDFDAFAHFTCNLQLQAFVGKQRTAWKFEFANASLRHEYKPSQRFQSQVHWIARSSRNVPLRFLNKKDTAPLVG